MKDLRIELFKYVLSTEFLSYFELVGINGFEDTMHLYLDEGYSMPEEYTSLALSSNGFYEASTIKDFPLRDKKVVLHVRRRRWNDKAWQSYSREWDLTAEGTRYSKEFAYFLKEAFGYLPDTGPVT